MGYILISQKTMQDTLKKIFILYALFVALSVVTTTATVVNDSVSHPQG